MLLDRYVKSEKRKYLHSSGGRRLKNKKTTQEDYFTYISNLIKSQEESYVQNVDEKLDEKSKWVEEYAVRYEAVKREIDNLVTLVKEKIQKCNPLELLSHIAIAIMGSNLNKTSELHYNAIDIFTLRVIEYIQSVIVSAENSCEDYYETVETQAFYDEIINDVIELNLKFEEFFVCMVAIKEKGGEITDIEENYIIESQIMSDVRGKRYPFFQIQYYKNLIIAYDTVINELFNITAIQLLDGLEKLEYELTNGKSNKMKQLLKEHLGFADFSKGKTIQEIDEYIEKSKNRHFDLMHNLWGYQGYEVEKITGWPKSLIKELSYLIGENIAFYQTQEYAGWPSWNLPVQKRPFVRVNNKSYCFDYHVLFDNFYRNFQRIIYGLKPDFKAQGQEIQKEVSEREVEGLFQKILPGCKTYRENEYPKRESLKQTCENDLLVLYKNVLLIVEVKAGKFIDKPALTDYDAHKNSFHELVSVADEQCERTLQYIENHEVAPFYEKRVKGVTPCKKVEIEKRKYKYIYKIGITIDDFNVFTAKAEKIDFIHLHKKMIIWSIDDFRVYADYFSNPLEFLHFLKERIAATEVKQIKLNDELDHLGLYIDFNRYAQEISKLDLPSQIKNIGFIGYREELDNYYTGLKSGFGLFEKPCQRIPEKIQEILRVLVEIDDKYKVDIAMLILDATNNQRDKWNETIIYSIQRAEEIKHVVAFSSKGELRFSIFIGVPNIKLKSYDERIEYVKAMMIRQNELDRWMIYLQYDINQKLITIESEYINCNDITEAEMERLKLLGQEHAYSRVSTYKNRYNIKKIYPNEPCPCGSGKKYKKCCGKDRI